MDRIEQGWVGIDAGKGHHHIVLIDRDGRQLLSRRVDNDELALTGLIETVRDRVMEPTWAIDLADGAAALVIGLLLHRDQPVFYLPGIAVNRASADIAARARLTLRTPRSSRIRPGCGGICADSRCSTRTSPSCG